MRFHNPPGAPKRNVNPFKWLGFFYRRLTDTLPQIPDDFIIPSETVLATIKHAGDSDYMTWLGHNTLLTRLQGKTILTDPFLTDYASPIAGIGPRRFAPPALTVSQLPKIDVLLVSHDHYDHLDLATLAAIDGKESVAVVVPLKMGSFFKRLGYKKIYELNWHQRRTIGDITICALPAYHYSKRNIFVRNTRLWANFMITSQDKKLFFDGNTAYGSLFLDLGRDYGPFDYALLSIGAYEPHALMQESHTTPELAVKIGRELRAETIIPIHWGTIILSDEPPFAPPERFYQAALAEGFSRENIWIMKIGETRIMG
ncbi:MBL fold metallo-hydrolase [Legionella spiritensis]|uniref:Outer membrane protein RomA n=1 Tax=Legionella spiritensis TaxID=452 RepID=A0A0W0YWF0_LEGSP|nr:MBL fold metallo-hydrolase [Legionella spiritensis]KTD61163.1 outer membrane protein RomA [Legionella spiritensis]SNV45310.1 outer membrane protein RomA [Legionella spiritensis]